MSNKIVVIGSFNLGEELYSGQVAKVRDYYYYIKNRFGEDNVSYVDIGGYKKKPVSVFSASIKSLKNSDKVVLLLCGVGYGIKLFLPLVLFLKKWYKYRIYFSIVGGGIINDFDQKKKLKKQIEKVDELYVETKALKCFFETKGLKNVQYAPVFSKRTGVSFEEIRKDYSKSYELCTYSRVIKSKGISDAIDAVVEVNRRLGEKTCILDIYGDPIGDYSEEFNLKVNMAGDCVRRHALLTDANAIKELSKHYLMLFPTYYDSEGFPIALIECMKSGVPIVATDWHFNSEIIDNKRTGIIYIRNEHENILADIICELISDNSRVLNMKKECIEEAKKYDPDYVLKHLYSELEKE